LLLQQYRRSCERSEGHERGCARWRHGREEEETHLAKSWHALETLLLLARDVLEAIESDDERLGGAAGRIEVLERRLEHADVCLAEREWMRLVAGDGRAVARVRRGGRRA